VIVGFTVTDALPVMERTDSCAFVDKKILRRKKAKKCFINGTI